MLTLPVRAGWGRFTIPRMVSRQRRPCCLAGVHQSVSRSWRPRVPSTSTPSAMGVPRVCSRARSRPRSARHGATRGWTACARQPVAWPGRRQSAAPLLPWTGVRGGPWQVGKAPVLGRSQPGRARCRMPGARPPPGGTPVSVGARRGCSRQPACRPGLRRAFSRGRGATNPSCATLSKPARLSPAKRPWADARSDHTRWP
jgi:hypothetical protein